MYKAVFFDIDCTLFNDKGEILESTIQAIKALNEQNIIVGIATGRSKPMIFSVLEKFSFDTLVLLNDGFSSHQGRPEVMFPFLKEELNELAFRAKKYGHGLTFCGENACHLVQNSRTMQTMIDKFKAPCFHYEQTQTEEIYAIWLDCPTNEVEIYQDLQYSIAPWTGVEGMHDILIKNVSKLQGIHKLVEKLGISIKETIAFGDGFNDVEMLSGVGLGIAMGNAPIEVKNRAKMVTSSNNENGISNALKKLELI